MGARGVIAFVVSCPNQKLNQVVASGDSLETLSVCDILIYSCLLVPGGMELKKEQEAVATRGSPPSSPPRTPEAPEPPRCDRRISFACYRWDADPGLSTTSFWSTIIRVELNDICQRRVRIWGGI